MRAVPFVCLAVSLGCHEGQETAAEEEEPEKSGCRWLLHADWLVQVMTLVSVTHHQVLLGHWDADGVSPPHFPIKE